MRKRILQSINEQALKMRKGLARMCPWIKVPKKDLT